MPHEYYDKMEHNSIVIVNVTPRMYVPQNLIPFYQSSNRIQKAHIKNMNLFWIPCKSFLSQISFKLFKIRFILWLGPSKKKRHIVNVFIIVIMIICVYVKGKICLWFYTAIKIIITFSTRSFVFLKQKKNQRRCPCSSIQRWRAWHRSAKIHLRNS